MRQSRAIIVPLDQKDRKSISDFMMSQYIGKACTLCGHQFESMEDIDSRNIVKSDHDGGSACLACWKKANIKEEQP